MNCTLNLPQSTTTHVYFPLCVHITCTHSTSFSQGDAQARSERSTSHSDEEILAQASCQALASQQENYGRVYAVGRECTSSSGNCNAICGSAFLHVQDPQTVHSTWSSIGAFHIYQNQPSTTFGTLNDPVEGLKSKLEPSSLNGCGPNFCCCIAN